MSHKLLPGVVAAVAIVPICAVCILGPAAIGAMVAGAFGWLGGLNPVLTTGLAIIFGIVIYAIVRQRRLKPFRRASDASYEPPGVSDQTGGHSQSFPAAASFQHPSNSGFEQPNSVGGDQR